MKAGHLSASPTLKVHRPCVCVGGFTGWGQVSFKALKKLKGLGLGQQEQGGLHSLTWWGFWSELPPHGSLSHCVSFSSACLKSAGRKVTPSWSQRVRRGRGGRPVAIANVQTSGSFFFFVYTKNTKRDCKAIDPVPGHLKKFWQYTPRIPGISRVFQSYMVWDLGTPRSQEEQCDVIAWNKQQRKKTNIRSVFLSWLRFNCRAAGHLQPLHLVPENLST